MKLYDWLIYHGVWLEDPAMWIDITKECEPLAGDCMSDGTELFVRKSMPIHYFCRLVEDGDMGWVRHCISCGLRLHRHILSDNWNIPSSGRVPMNKHHSEPIGLP